MHYYELQLNSDARGLWHLRDPYTPDGEQLDPRIFTRGLRYEGTQPLTVKRPKGRPARLSLNSFMYPVAAGPLAKRLLSIEPTLQVLSLVVEGEASDDEYGILNVLRIVDAIDEASSVFERHTKSGSRPDRAGEYHFFRRLRLAKNRVPADAHVFRLEGHRGPLIVSEDARTVIESMGGNDGACFDAVTDG